MARKRIRVEMELDVADFPGTMPAIKDRIREYVERFRPAFVPVFLAVGEAPGAAEGGTERQGEPVGGPLASLLGEGARIEETGALPDGSGYAVASMPLPPNHWLYGSAQRPPMSFRMGKGPARDDFEWRLTEAGRYAVKAATMSGKDDDFDPDALIQNLIVGACGYHTATGLTEMGPEEAAAVYPIPVPPLYKTIPQE